AVPAPPLLHDDGAPGGRGAPGDRPRAHPPAIDDGAARPVAGIDRRALPRPLDRAAAAPFGGAADGDALTAESPGPAGWRAPLRGTPVGERGPSGPSPPLS